MKNQNELVKKYPEFFEYLRDHKGPIIPIQFGFECGDGWYWLISNLMGEIHNHCKSNKKPYPEIVQIKEKYGGLRFYYNGGSELIHGMVHFAETLSYQICESCGTTENVTTNDLPEWIFTLCDTCRKKKSKRNYIKHIKWRIKKIGWSLKSLNNILISKVKKLLVFQQNLFLELNVDQCQLLEKYYLKKFQCFTKINVKLKKY